MRTHEQTVNAQFDPRAQAYLTSAVHASGPDLKRAAELVAGASCAQGAVLDVGCGAGHLSFALAPFVKRVVAYDASRGMLETVARSASERGLGQIETAQGIAEALPFADATFDLVASRYSAHHWTDLGKAMAELHRVLKPDGALLMIDTLGDENPLVDVHLQSVELLRDTSHVRNRSGTQWRALLRAAGFAEPRHQESWPTRLEFKLWAERMRTPADRVAIIRGLLNGAPQEVQTALAVESDSSFTIQTGLFWAQRTA